MSDLAVERRWGAYLKVARERGVSSILAVPLDLAGEAEAVLNLYSGRSNRFSEDDVSTVEAFTRQAASSVRLVLRITQLSEARSDLASAMQSRIKLRDVAASVIRSISGEQQIVTYIDE